MTDIVKTEDVMGGKARLDGRRVSVFQIGEMYTVAGDTPEEIADQLSVSLADVHTALAYYYDHPEEMTAIREHQEAVIDDLAERSMAPEEAAR
jgi:uncharacterized protein (DUF433 family)